MQDDGERGKQASWCAVTRGHYYHIRFVFPAIATEI